jgi:predicted MPP superfamily phosphohydrolase
MFYQPHIDHVQLPCPRLPAAFDGLTILHLSDLHVTRWNRRLQQWQEALYPLKPHLLAITGDLGHRSWLWKTSLGSIQRLLEKVRPPLGGYFILGNHDSVKLGPAVEDTGRTLLENESIILEKDGQRLALVGLNQHRRIDTDIPVAMRNVNPTDFKLLLLHYPDLIHQAIAAGADVCLAGHTHGGQICWPDGRPIIRHDTLPQDMCTGVHKVDGTWMVVNRGIGVAGIRLRVFCPPHAIMLTLRSGEVAAPVAKPYFNYAAVQIHTAEPMARTI